MDNSSIFSNDLNLISDQSLNDLPNISSYESIEHVNDNLYNKYYDKVLNAAKQLKIFTIDGHYPTIRKALLQRGWIEKSIPDYLKSLNILSFNTLIKNAANGNIYEQLTLAKLANYFPTNFIWQSSAAIGYSIYNTNSYYNRIYRSKMYNFTNKQGLNSCIEKLNWRIINDLSDIQAPRLHRLDNYKGQLEFLQDYRTTYCLSLLKFICSEHHPNKLFSKNGSISLAVIEFAIGRIKSEIKFKENSNLHDNNPDNNSDQFSDVSGKWQFFYNIVNNLINKKEKFISNDSEEIHNYIKMCRNILNKSNMYWSHLKADGYHNLWILKPSIANRGEGLVIKKDINDIIDFVKKYEKTSYLIQKYIERPLLIYKTKFDIRQYILLSITETKYNIWIYRDCYLSFSSQEYEINDLNNSIHITSTNKNKKKNSNHNDNMPNQNQWSLRQFQAYLKSIDKDDIWYKKIFPSMKYNIIAIILATLDETKFIPKSFELYGCDFILDEDYQPILIEINSLPYTSNSTTISEKICTNALEDLIKVIIDKPKSPTANTDNYELIYSLDYKNPLKDIKWIKKGGKQLTVPQVMFEEPTKDLNTKQYKEPFKKSIGSKKKKIIRFKSQLV